MFNSPGYNLKFIQKTAIKDGSSHLYKHIYKFKSEKTRLIYIVHADEHEHDFFAVKFYAKKDRKSDYKYSKIINKGDVVNILVTCIKVIPILLASNPLASFGFVGSRSLDEMSDKVESFSRTQRYRIYVRLVSTRIRHVTFTHFDYEAVSGYMLINNKHSNIDEVEAKLKRMLAETYSNITNI